MFTIFAHAGHEMESTYGMSALDHCMPIIITSGISIAILVGVIIYLLVAWQPKKVAKATKKKSSKS